MNNNKILSLESLRGIAALAVVLFHFVTTFYPNVAGNGIIHSSFEKFLTQTPLFYLINGTFSVTLFFVLSGFVLSSSFFKHEVDLVAASVKRYFRLMPVVFASVILAFICLRLGLFHNKEAGLIAINWPNPDLAFLQAFFEGLIGIFTIAPAKADQSLNPVLWTIYYELIGSLITYAVLALCGRDSRRKFIYPVLILTFLITPYIGFIIGIILADMYYNKKNIFEYISKLSIFYKLAFLTLAVILASFPPFKTIESLNHLYKPLVIIGGDYGLSMAINYLIASVIIIIMVLSSNKMRKFFELRPLVYLGSISYSLYATHYIILGTVVTSMYIWLLKYFSYNKTVLIIFPVYIAVAIITAIIFKRYIDKPSIKLSSLVGDKIKNLK